MPRSRTLLAGLAAGMFATLAGAATQLPSSRDLADLSLEQLADLEVTTVSKRRERLSDAPASVYVITADDIRRSGAATLPEALRLAPNLQVSQVNAATYNIRARGINNNSANKLLVLIDGRSVYSPLFSGVFWDVQDLVLDDVERIEVISGPGGTLWGVNAVNGVINVITRSASATQGGLVALDGGERATAASVRHGMSLGTHGHYRVHGRHLDRSRTSTASGTTIPDDGHVAQGGFRADWRLPRDEVTLLGNAYRGRLGQPPPGSIAISGVNLALAPIDASGANATLRWARRLDGGSHATVQAYIDRTERTVPPTFAEKLDIVDLQLEHAMRWDARALVWGAQYRASRDRVANSDIFAFLPAELSQKWTSLFAQGEADLRENVRVTAGIRLERNDYTGTEYLPNVRIAWKATPDSLLWSAASRTVRAPSRLDRDAFVPGRPPFLLAGGPDVPAEVANVFEVGYRGHRATASYSVTLFQAKYRHLHTQEIAPSGTFIVFDGLMQASTYGVEMWGAMQLTDRWRLAAGLMAQHETFRLEPGSNDAAAVGLAGRDPAHTWLVRSSWTPSRSWEFDLTVRGVAALANPAVPRYATADVRLGWRPLRTLEIAIGAANLGDGGHGEFTGIATRTEIGRNVYASLRWSFGAP